MNFLKTPITKPLGIVRLGYDESLGFYWRWERGGLPLRVCDLLGFAAITALVLFA